MAEEQKNSPAADPAPVDDGLDVIPVNKMPVGLIVGILAALLVVGGALAWSSSGGKSTKAGAGEGTPKAQQTAPSKEELKERREFMAMTQRAMAKHEQEEKAAQAAKEAEKAAAAEAAEGAKRAAASKAAGPAPVTGAAATKAAGDLDSALSDTLSGLE